MKKIISIIICILMFIGVTPISACKPTTIDNRSDNIVILYENDVHCAIDGYSKLSAMKKDLTNKYDHVGVVSSGDFVQGGTIGAVSKGEYIINLMNLVGYDALTLGNHEFDYQLPRLSELVQKMNTKPVSCNFYKIGEKESYFKPYNIVSYGDIDIAYIGITTPETISSSTPSQFQNDKGEVIYSFSSNNLYETVQKSIDAAENDGADYVIALSRIGYTEDEGIMDITDIIANTDGLDVVLDAHSHSIIEEKSVKDKNGVVRTGPFYPHNGAFSEYFINYYPALEFANAIKYARLGDAIVEVFDVKKGTDLIKHILSKTTFDVGDDYKTIPESLYNDFK